MDKVLEHLLVLLVALLTVSVSLARFLTLRSEVTSAFFVLAAAVFSLEFLLPVQAGDVKWLTAIELLLFALAAVAAAMRLFAVGSHFLR